MIARLIALAALGAALAAAPAARADHDEINLPLPELLPPQPTPVGVQPHPVEGCDRPSVRCVEDVVAEMTRRWAPLDRSCDHRAVFALTYLRTTEGLLRTLRRDPRFFDDFDYIVWEDVLFAEYYFRAYDQYASGRGGVPDAWRIAFDTARRGDANGGQDVLLGMNAHIQRDLPYVLAELGLRKPNGESRKPDHDRVNRILTQVLDPIQDELADRYDPLFSFTDLKPAPADELGALELLKSWREGAWRNAERLLRAASPVERALVEHSIEDWSRRWAESISSPQQPGYRAQRDAYCRARHRADRGGGPPSARRRGRRRSPPATGAWTARGPRGGALRFTVRRRRGKLVAKGSATFPLRCDGRMRGSRRTERFEARLRRRAGKWSFVHRRKKSPPRGRGGVQSHASVRVVFDTARTARGGGRLSRRRLDPRHRVIAECASGGVVWPAVRGPRRKR